MCKLSISIVLALFCLLNAEFAFSKKKLSLASVYADDSSALPQRRLKAITRTALDQIPFDYGDPSPPKLNCEGDLVITTTGGHLLKWSRATPDLAWKAFLRGEAPSISQLRFFHDAFTPLNLELGEDVWDPALYCINSNEVVIGSIMPRPKGAANARWPDDHWARRTYVFTNQNDKLISSAQPFFSEVTTNWLHHNYGHGLVYDDNGNGHVFYERVSEEKNGAPFKTEIFSRSVKNYIEPYGSEVQILKIPTSPWASAKRSDGGLLVEGPRPFKMNGITGLSISGGDYNSDHYGIHLLWQTENRNFEPVLGQNGDLLDFGKEIRKVFPMTWGPARAVFFEYEGQWWVLFHGIPIGSLHDTAEGRRDIFLAPVQVQHGRFPKIKIQY